MRARKWMLTTGLVIGLLSSQAAMANPQEDPAQFVSRYYQAVAASKSPLDTKEFMSARVREKQDKNPLPKELAGVMAEMMLKSLLQRPSKVKIVNKAVSPGKAVLELAPLDVPQHFKDMAKDATAWSLKGSMVLVDEGNSWKVDKDMWKFSAKTKNGTFSESSGVTGADDNDDSPSSGAAPGAAKPATGLSSDSGTRDFDKQVRDKLMNAVHAWKDSSGRSIYVLVTVGTDGKIVGLKVRGETPQPAAEKRISNLLVTSQPFFPLAIKYKAQRNIWMMFDWTPQSASVSGPYFSSDPHPEWLRNKVGM